MNQRIYLCLLLCGVMLYYAVPRLSIEAGGVQGLFSITWIIFMLLAIAGNLTAILYAPRKQKAVVMKEQKRVRKYL